MTPRSLRILVLGPGSNPRSVTGALIGYSFSAALARLHSVTLVIMARDEEAVRWANGRFSGIEPIPSSWVDRLDAWVFRRLFQERLRNLLWTALSFPLPLTFEMQAWRRLRSRIRSGEFDVVLRVLPIVPTMASPFAFFLRNGPIPFVIGPLNGGLPWPEGFSQLVRQRAAAGNWVARMRPLYRLLPFSRSTYARATAIIAGSSHTWAELSGYRDKVFYVPGENGIDSSWLETPREPSSRAGRLELVYVGRLVPYKACDLALRGAAPLLRDGRARLSVVGDGPERQRFEDLAREMGVSGAVTFCGMLSHSKTLSHLRSADVLLFPSLREFGGGVVFEAFATGVVPVVADYGGPGDIVKDEVGYRIPLTDEHQMAARIHSVLENLASDRDTLERLRRQGTAYARDHLTWDAKARMVTEILQWSVGAAPKPAMSPSRPGSWMGAPQADSTAR